MNRTTALRLQQVIGHTTFIALLILAWKHAELRTTSGDSAYQIFKWVNDAGLNIEAHRYSAIFPELAVKFFKCFHADLKTLLLVASVAHVLVAYLVFLICLFWLKAPRSALAVTLAAVLCTRLTFYGPVLEANYLLSYPFLFFGILERNGSTPIGVRSCVHLVISGALTLLAHPLGWLILLYGTVFIWAIRHISAKTALAVSTGLVIGAGSVRLLFPPTAYEQAQYGNLLEALSGQGLTGSWGSWDFLVGHTFHYTTNYLPALVLVIVVVIGLVMRKHMFAAVVLAGGVISFLVLEVVTFRAGDAAIMMDRAFLPVATIIALPAGFLLGRLHGRWFLVASACLVAVLFIKLRDISFGSREPQRQLNRKVALINDLRMDGVSKARAGDDVLIAHGITVDWAFPWSIMLLSAEGGPDRTILVLHTSDAEGKQAAGSTNTIPDSETLALGLDTTYFRLPIAPYVRLGDLSADPR